MKNLAPLVAVIVLGTTHCLSAAEIAVDLNLDNGRKDILTPTWQNWAWQDGRSDSMTIGSVVVTFAASEEGGVVGTWYKGLLDFGATMAADGITVQGDLADGSLQMRIRGLAPGRHSVATYHNEVRNVEPTEFDVLLGDSPASQ